MPARWISAAQITVLVRTAPFTAPAYRDIADRLRLLIIDGQLAHDARLPSERDLAAGLGISRSTVAATYTTLREAGYLQSRPGSGHYVTLPHPCAASSHLPGGRVSADGSIGLNCASGTAPPGLAAAYRSAAEGLPGLLSGNGYLPDGLSELRRALADGFTARGLRTGSDQIIVTTGALSALNVIGRALLAPGDRVLMESPTYPNAIEAIRRTGARPVAYPLPTDGWDPAGYDLALRQSAARLAFVIPEFHNPTGEWLSEEARPEIAAALRRNRTTAVIDETLLHLGLDDPTLRTPLAAYLPDALAIGSASKAFWGGLRIGWIRAPRELVGPLIEARAVLDLGSAPFEQLVVSRLLSDSSAVLAGQRDRLRLSRDHFLDLLRTRFPDWLVGSAAGGLSLWAKLPDERSSRLAVHADRHGLALTPGPRFFVTGGGERHLRLPFTADPETLTEAVTRLEAAWADSASGSGLRRVGRDRTASLDLSA